ncbi:hypothetical protein NA56DRAFT_710063 [Hyaloscypha hepaticicola]|uniref:Uncharacterized protein n=1 Tax=Hyaloscypha hepaticicola TaxID=2082293 RepID=A0A2J6PM60_9HELO|nr:hypothetical protein NA56DRAFT_710063 [Hyaloscypha hepaticicola]
MSTTTTTSPHEPEIAETSAIQNESLIHALREAKITILHSESNQKLSLEKELHEKGCRVIAGESKIKVEKVESEKEKKEQFAKEMISEVKLCAEYVKEEHQQRMQYAKEDHDTLKRYMKEEHGAKIRVLEHIDWNGQMQKQKGAEERDEMDVDDTKQEFERVGYEEPRLMLWKRSGRFSDGWKEYATLNCIGLNGKKGIY